MHIYTHIYTHTELSMLTTKTVVDIEYTPSELQKLE